MILLLHNPSVDYSGRVRDALYGFGRHQVCLPAVNHGNPLLVSGFPSRVLLLVVVLMLLLLALTLLFWASY